MNTERERAAPAGPREKAIEHCRDCCCARSWDALGITEFTGLTIPEHIRTFREALARIADRDIDPTRDEANDDAMARIARAALNARLT